MIFHVGSHLGAGFEAGLERVVPAMEQILEHSSETTWLLMENSAGAGGTIGRSLDELVALYEACGKHERLGICLDSCHLWVSGYDVTDRAALDALLGDLDKRIGLDRLRALHVNDAKAPLGSNHDRHENLLDGLIGEGLGMFLGHPAVQGLPAVMEVPGDDGHGPDAGEMKKLAELHRAGSPPEPRPSSKDTSLDPRAAFRFGHVLCLAPDVAVWAMATGCVADWSGSDDERPAVDGLSEPGRRRGRSAGRPAAPRTPGSGSRGRRCGAR